MEPNKVYEFELEPVNSEAHVSDLSENHPNSDHYPISGTDNTQLDFQDSEFVNPQEAQAPITAAHNEQPQESSNCCEDQFKTKQNQSTHKCDICGFTATKRYLLARHVKSHFIDAKSPFKCHLCDEAYSSETSLKKHSLKHTRAIKRNVCTWCSSKFPTTSELKRHVQYKHTHEKNFKCAQCDYASVEKGKVKRHMACHTGERPHQCKDCSMAFPTFFNLKRHIRTHTMEKPYKCEICSTSFAQLNALQWHRKLHTGDKPLFQCDVCPSTFGRKCDLANHNKRIHTSDTPVHCEKCGNVFKDLYSLKCHKKEHKRFSCSLCTFSCTSLNNFRKHSNTHTGLKPLKCDLCDECFDEKGRLKNHQILAHTEFKPLKKQKCKRIRSRVKCHHCVKTFSSEGHLQRHLRLVKMAKRELRSCTVQLQKLKNHQILVHTEVKPLKKQKWKKIRSRVKCHHCVKTFSSEGHLQRHLRIVKMATDSDEKAFKWEPTNEESYQVLSSDLSVPEVLIPDISVQEVLNSDTDHIKPVEELKVNNGVIEFDFDSDDDSSEEVSVHVEIDSENKSKEKIRFDIKTFFGFNEYF